MGQKWVHHFELCCDSQGGPFPFIETSHSEDGIRVQVHVKTWGNDVTVYSTGECDEFDDINLICSRCGKEAKINSVLA